MQGTAVSRTPKNVDAETSSCPIRPGFSRKKGRPPNAMAGDVEERILDAATAMFLQHGFGGASLERIAEAAGAGKATLYSRYSGKESLFSEVIKRNCERSLRLVYEAPQSAALTQRLASMTQTLVTRLLSDEVIALIRMVVADAPRFPSLARLTSDAGRSRAIEAAATMIAENSGRTFKPQARAANKRHSRTLATQILDAIVAPMLMRALMGENLDDVRGDISSHVKQTIALFVEANALDDFL
ncbi:TetR/AcrR family transcriptional regulator [Paraburkholderia sediminicola]|uniref:TetR/AcrR family transcriptional regulator n=2 Tax=Paraburkholderia TaxID=1822464 RepID=A0ABW9DW05_9BURK